MNRVRKPFFKILLAVQVMVPAVTMHAGFETVVSDLLSKARGAMPQVSNTTKAYFAAGVTASLALCALGRFCWNRYVVLGRIADQIDPLGGDRKLYKLGAHAGEDSAESFLLQTPEQKIAFIKELSNDSLVSGGHGPAVVSTALVPAQEAPAWQEFRSTFANPQISAGAVADLHEVAKVEAHVADIRERCAVEKRELEAAKTHLDRFTDNRMARLVRGSFCEGIAPLAYPELKSGVCVAQGCRSDDASALSSPALSIALSAQCKTRWSNVVIGQANFGKAAGLRWDVEKRLCRLTAIEAALTTYALLMTKRHILESDRQRAQAQVQITHNDTTVRLEQPRQ